MMKTVSISFFSILLACSVFSCKKQNNTQQSCNLATITDSTTSVQSVTQFTYDNSNRVTSIVVTGQNACVRTLQYVGNNVIFNVKDTTPGIVNETDTAVLNNGGLLQTFSSYYPSSNTTTLQTYNYDATGVATSRTTTNNGIPGDTIEYNTVNGNLMYDNYKGQTTHKDEFTYYTTQKIVYGDPTYFRQLLYYGSYYYMNSNMLSLLYAPGKSYKAYTYSFSNGRIAQASLRQWLAGDDDTVTHIMSYAYSCK